MCAIGINVWVCTFALPTFVQINIILYLKNVQSCHQSYMIINIQVIGESALHSQAVKMEHSLQTPMQKVVKSKMAPKEMAAMILNVNNAHSHY